MKLTKSKLKQLIKEELEALRQEQGIESSVRAPTDESLQQLISLVPKVIECIKKAGWSVALACGADVAALHTAVSNKDWRAAYGAAGKLYDCAQGAGVSAECLELLEQIKGLLG